MAAVRAAFVEWGVFVMNAVITGAPQNAKMGGENSFTKSAKPLPVLAQIVNAIRGAWPRKTAAHVAHFTGMDERTVKFWLAGETRMSVESIGALLRTEEGYPILEAIMADSRANWWLATQTAQQLRQSRRELKTQEDRVARLRSQLSLLD